MRVAERGRSAHSSQPDLGSNAIHAAADVVGAVRDRADKLASAGPFNHLFEPYCSTGKRRDRHKHGAAHCARGSDIVTVREWGIVTKADVEAAVPQLVRLIEERSPLRLNVDLIRLDQFESAGLWEELKFDLGHRSDIGRIAFLVNTPGEEWAGWQ
jgi:hypothetical protein